MTCSYSWKMSLRLISNGAGTCGWLAAQRDLR